MFKSLAWDTMLHAKNGLTSKVRRHRNDFHLLVFTLTHSLTSILSLYMKNCSKIGFFWAVLQHERTKASANEPHKLNYFFLLQTFSSSPHIKIEQFIKEVSVHIHTHTWAWHVLTDELIIALKLLLLTLMVGTKLSVENFFVFFSSQFLILVYRLS